MGVEICDGGTEEGRISRAGESGFFAFCDTVPAGGGDVADAF